MIRSQHRGVVLSSSDLVSGEYIQPCNASRIVRCCCSELPRPLIPSGRGFHWRQILIFDKSFISDRSFIPNRRRYLEYYYRHPLSAAARAARDRIMSAAALEMMLII